jgi:hypothetical protein
MTANVEESREQLVIPETDPVLLVEVEILQRENLGVIVGSVRSEHGRLARVHGLFS